MNNTTDTPKVYEYKITFSIGLTVPPSEGYMGKPWRWVFDSVSQNLDTDEFIADFTCEEVK